MKFMSRRITKNTLKKKRRKLNLSIKTNEFLSRWIEITHERGEEKNT